MGVYLDAVNHKGMGIRILGVDSLSVVHSLTAL